MNGCTITPKVEKNSLVFKKGQVWKGWYVCSQGKTALNLKINRVSGNNISAIFDFNYNNGKAVGQFELSGRHDPRTQKMELYPGKWI